MPALLTFGAGWPRHAIDVRFSAGERTTNVHGELFRFDPTDIAGARLQRLSFGRVGGFTELADRDIDGHAQVILCFTNPRAD